MAVITHLCFPRQYRGGFGAAVGISPDAGVKAKSPPPGITAAGRSLGFPTAQRAGAWRVIEELAARNGGTVQPIRINRDSRRIAGEEPEDSLRHGNTRGKQIRDGIADFPWMIRGI